MIEPKSRHAIITGGSSGIGKAVALLLAKNGYHISIIARRQALIDSAVKEIQASCDQSINIYGCSADVADKNSIDSAIQQCIEKNGPPDILLTAAGIATAGCFADLSTEVFTNIMNTNYLGTVYAIKAVHAIMQQRKSGHIVLISSGVGLIGLFGYSAYSPTKFAVRGLAESIRPELKRQGINIAVVYPPNTDTPMLTEERKIAPKENKLLSNIGGTLSAEEVAQEIVRGIKNHSFIIAPNISMKLLARMHSLVLPLLNWYFDRLIK